MSPWPSEYASLHKKGEETEKRDLVSLILSCGAVFLWFGSLWTTRVWWVPTRLPLGLFHMLPSFFWVALLIAIASITVNIRSTHKSLFFLQLLCLSTILVGTPVLVETNARHVDSWAHLGAALQLIESGLPNPKSAPSSWLDVTLQVPGSFLFHATVMEIAEPPVLLYLRVFPLFSSTIFLLGYFAWLSSETILVRKLTSLLVLLSNVWMNFYFGTQSYGLMLLPVAVIGLGKMRKGPFGWKLAAVLVWAGLSLSHPTTAGTLLIIFAGEGLVRKTVERRDSGLRWFLLVALIFISSTFYNGPAVVHENIKGIEEFLSSGMAIEYGKLLLSRPVEVLSKPTFSSGSALASLIRLSTIVIGAAAAWFWVMWALRRRISGVSQGFAWMLTCSLLVLASLTAGPATILAGYAAARSLGLMFFIVPLLLTRLGIQTNSTGLATRIASRIPLLLCALAFLSLYYVENGRIVPSSDLANVAFLYTHSAGRILAGSNFSPFLTTGPHLDFFRVDLADPAKVLERVASGSVIVSDSYSNSISLSSNVKNLWAAYGNSPASNRVYDNSWFTDAVISGTGRQEA